MAEKEKVQETAKETVREELNLDANVTVKSIANWKTGFPRVTTPGDVMIAPCGSIRLTRNEIIAQVQTGNKLFCGVDGMGKHATYFIDDDATRIHVGFDTEDGSVKQDVFSDTKVKDLFKITAQSTFEKECKEMFCTRAEKYALVAAIKKLKLNDFSKIRFVENYTGYTVE